MQAKVRSSSAVSSSVLFLYFIIILWTFIHSISSNCFRLHGFTVNDFVHLTGILLWFFSIKCQLAYYFRFFSISIDQKFPLSIDYYYYAFKMIIYYDAWHRKSGFTLIWTRLIVKCACLSHFFIYSPSKSGCSWTFLIRNKKFSTNKSWIKKIVVTVCKNLEGSLEGILCFS